ncbi:rhomboid-like protein [Streptomyces sp. JV178]|uniref:rhomboid-like protein n=1 Tax=Streptomyces sp. JV178 TaxID=858632 RepID=UPI0027D30A7A|nr:rhomboid-like protein [Streptomyces sp. JV178]
METGTGPDRTDVTPSAAGPFLNGIPRQPGAVTPVRGGGEGDPSGPGVERAGPAELPGPGVVERAGPAESLEPGVVERPGLPGPLGPAAEQARLPKSSGLGCERVAPSACRGRSGRLALGRRARPTPAHRSLPRPWRLLPTPTGTPFTFWYLAVLLLTSLITEYADPAVVHALHQGFSTDVAHLVGAPVPVLVASALWIAGGVASPYALGFVLVLTALERRIGGRRTAMVFLLGHVLATLATEIPVGVLVLTGGLPGSSLHRLDYGISFGVAASVGALTALLPWWSRWPLLFAFGWMLLEDLVAFTDPMTNWGHLIALAIGIATWPVVRRWRRAATARDAAPPLVRASATPVSAWK